MWEDDQRFTDQRVRDWHMDMVKQIKHNLIPGLIVNCRHFLCFSFHSLLPTSQHNGPPLPGFFQMLLLETTKVINRPVTSHLFYWACSGTPTRLERRQIQFWVLDAIGRGSRRSPSNHRSHLDWSARWFPAETHIHHPDNQLTKWPKGHLGEVNQPPGWSSCRRRGSSQGFQEWGQHGALSNLSDQAPSLPWGFLRWPSQLLSWQGLENVFSQDLKAVTALSQLFQENHFYLLPSSFHWRCCSPRVSRYPMRKNCSKLEPLRF